MSYDDNEVALKLWFNFPPVRDLKEQDPLGPFYQVFSFNFAKAK